MQADFTSTRLGAAATYAAADDMPNAHSRLHAVAYSKNKVWQWMRAKEEERQCGHMTGVGLAARRMPQCVKVRQTKGAQAHKVASRVWGGR
jgi:hypothetical protein